jgi:hypothetical protein
MFKDLAGKDVYENKIEAIKAVRNLMGKIQITLNPNPPADAPHKREIETYIPLRDAKDITEAIMALGVEEWKKRQSNLQHEERFNRSPSSNNVFPQFITEGQRSGYTTHYTLAGALVTCREDKSIERITVKEQDGSEHILYRNPRQQIFELDLI